MIVSVGKQKFDLPLFVSERTNNHLSEFNAARRRLRKTINDIQKNDKEGETTPIPDERLAEHLLDICQTMCGDGVSLCPHFLPQDTGKDLVKERFRYTIKSIGEPLSLERIFAHLFTMIEYYEPKSTKQSDFKFKWYDIKTVKEKEVRLKQTYYLNAGRVGRVVTGNGFTSGEVIETMELERIRQDAIEKTLDLDGNLSFTLNAKKMALLVRAKGVDLPSGMRERTEHIEKYTKIFAEVPMDVILDIGFFLESSFKLYVKTEIVNGSLKRKNQRLQESK